MAKQKAESHSLARGEKITAKSEDGTIAVTDQGRKVQLDKDGKVTARLVGPLYSWEQEPDEDKQPEE